MSKAGVKISRSASRPRNRPGTIRASTLADPVAIPRTQTALRPESNTAPGDCQRINAAYAISQTLAASAYRQSDNMTCICIVPVACCPLTVQSMQIPSYQYCQPISAASRPPASTAAPWNSCGGRTTQFGSAHAWPMGSAVLCALRPPLGVMAEKKPPRGSGLLVLLVQSVQGQSGRNPGSRCVACTLLCVHGNQPPAPARRPMSPERPDLVMLASQKARAPKDLIPANTQDQLFPVSFSANFHCSP